MKATGKQMKYAVPIFGPVTQVDHNNHPVGERFIRNQVKLVSSKYDGIAGSGKSVVLSGDGYVDVPINATIKETYNGIISANYQVTITDIGEGNWNIVSISNASSASFSFRETTPVDLGVDKIIKFDAVINSGEMIIDSYYDGSKVVMLDEPLTVQHAGNELTVNLTAAYNTNQIRVYCADNANFDVDIINTRIERIENVQGQITYFDFTQKKHISPTLPLSLTFKLENVEFNNLVVLLDREFTQADLDKMDTDPESVIRWALGSDEFSIGLIGADDKVYACTEDGGFLLEINDDSEPPSTDFILVFRTTTDNEDIQLPTRSNGTYDFTVTWGDGTSDYITSYDQAEVTHTYATAGDYEVHIDSTFTHVQFWNNVTAPKLIAVNNLGKCNFQIFDQAFRDCSNLEKMHAGYCDVSQVTSFREWFYNNTTPLTDVQINTLNPDSLTYWGHLFRNINDDIDVSGFDTSKATDITSICLYNKSPVLDVSGWDVSNVITMNNSFRGVACTVLDVSNWDVSKITNFNFAFQDSSNIELLDITNWDTSSATSFFVTFRNIKDNMIDPRGLNIGNVTNMTEMFKYTTIDTNIYDETLINFNNQPHQLNITFDGGGSKYTPGSAAETARNNLTNNDGWTITDGGPASLGRDDKTIVSRTTFGNRDDVIVYDDGTVDVNGVPDEEAIVTEYEGEYRVALDPAEPTVLHVNAIPEFSRIKITREEGWQGNLGWRAQLLDYTEDMVPNNIALAVYENPEANGYLFTTGAFTFNDKSGYWESVCPPGFEPGQETINFSMLYGSAKYSVFSLYENFDESEFMIGGDL